MADIQNVYIEDVIGPIRSLHICAKHGSAVL